MSYRHPKNPSENLSKKLWIRSACIVTLLVAAHGLQRLAEENPLSGLSAQQISFSQALSETDLRQADPRLVEGSIPFGDGNTWLTKVTERVPSSAILPAEDASCEKAKGDRHSCQTIR